VSCFLKAQWSERRGGPVVNNKGDNTIRGKRGDQFRPDSCCRSTVTHPRAVPTLSGIYFCPKSRRIRSRRTAFASCVSRCIRGSSRSSLRMRNLNTSKKNYLRQHHKELSGLVQCRSLCTNSINLHYAPIDVLCRSNNQMLRSDISRC
jgi:hypothetical protein